MTTASIELSSSSGIPVLSLGCPRSYGLDHGWKAAVKQRINLENPTSQHLCQEPQTCKQNYRFSNHTPTGACLKMEYTIGSADYCACDKPLCAPFDVFSLDVSKPLQFLFLPSGSNEWYHLHSSSMNVKGLSSTDHFV